MRVLVRVREQSPPGVMGSVHDDRESMVLIVQKDARDVLGQQVFFEYTNALLFEHDSDVSDGIGSESESIALFFGQALALLDCVPAVAREREIVLGWSRTIGRDPEQIFQMGVLACEVHAAANGGRARRVLSNLGVASEQRH